MIRSERFGDQGVKFITIGNGICNRCIHVSEDGQSCKAFPKGIPALILSGKIDHHDAVPGDHGIQFEARGGA